MFESIKNYLRKVFGLCLDAARRLIKEAIEIAEQTMLMVSYAVVFELVQALAIAIA